MKAVDIDNAITELLYNIDSPNKGYTTIELTKYIFGNDEVDKMSNEQFARACGKIGRRMGKMRHDIYDRLYKDEKDKNNDIDDISITKGLRPRFIPFARPIILAKGEHEKRVWKYLNAAKYKHIKKVVESHRNKATGLEWAARLLESVYQTDKEFSMSCSACGKKITLMDPDNPDRELEEHGKTCMGFNGELGK